MKTYEAMFLLDAGNPDFEQAAAPVRDLLTRAEAETLSMKPWDERRLAYEIRGRRRALYVLTYFKADPARMESMEHDIQLDERILRAMILSADHVDEKVVHAETPATQAQARKAAREAEEAAKEEAKEEAKKETKEKAEEKPEPEAKAEQPAKAEPEEKGAEQPEAEPAKPAGGGEAAEAPAPQAGESKPEAPAPPEQAGDSESENPGT